MSDQVGPGGVGIAVSDNGGFGLGGIADNGGFAVATSTPAPGGTQQVPIGVFRDPQRESGLFPLVMGARFRRRSWDPALYAQAVLAEFAASSWTEGLEIATPPSDSLEIAYEIATLIRKAGLRGVRAAELAAQAVDCSVYWSDALMMTRESHPATWDLIMVANAVGHMAAMHLKLRFMRPRPVQFYPPLMPPMLTPPHPSYPNAHMLESALIAASLELAVPALGSPRERLGPLDVLARRIGENREIAGLHFPSDTAASIALAPQLMERLVKGPLHREIVAEARREWEGIEVVPFPSS